MKKKKEKSTIPKVKPSDFNKKNEHSLLRHIKKEWRLYSLMVLPILYYIVFKYVPVIGNIIAFRRYKGAPIFWENTGWDFGILSNF